MKKDRMEFKQPQHGHAQTKNKPTARSSGNHDLLLQSHSSSSSTSPSTNPFIISTPIPASTSTSASSVQLLHHHPDPVSLNHEQEEEENYSERLTDISSSLAGGGAREGGGNGSNNSKSSSRFKAKSNNVKTTKTKTKVNNKSPGLKRMVDLVSRSNGIGIGNSEKGKVVISTGSSKSRKDTGTTTSAIKTKRNNAKGKGKGKQKVSDGATAAAAAAAAEDDDDDDDDLEMETEIAGDQEEEVQEEENEREDVIKQQLNEQKEVLLMNLKGMGLHPTESQLFQALTKITPGIGLTTATTTTSSSPSSSSIPIVSNSNSSSSSHSQSVPSMEQFLKVLNDTMSSENHQELEQEQSSSSSAPELNNTVINSNSTNDPGMIIMDVDVDNKNPNPNLNSMDIDPNFLSPLRSSNKRKRSTRVGVAKSSNGGKLYYTPPASTKNSPSPSKSPGPGHPHVISSRDGSSSMMTTPKNGVVVGGDGGRGLNGTGMVGGGGGGGVVGRKLMFTEEEDTTPATKVTNGLSTPKSSPGKVLGRGGGGGNGSGTTSGGGYSLGISSSSPSSLGGGSKLLAPGSSSGSPLLGHSQTQFLHHHLPRSPRLQPPQPPSPSHLRSTYHSQPSPSPPRNHSHPQHQPHPHQQQLLQPRSRSQNQNQSSRVDPALLIPPPSPSQYPFNPPYLPSVPGLTKTLSRDSSSIQSNPNSNSQLSQSQSQQSRAFMTDRDNIMFPNPAALDHNEADLDWKNGILSSPGRGRRMKLDWPSPPPGPMEVMDIDKNYKMDGLELNGGGGGSRDQEEYDEPDPPTPPPIGIDLKPDIDAYHDPSSSSSSNKLVKSLLPLRKVLRPPRSRRRVVLEVVEGGGGGDGEGMKTMAGGITRDDVGMARLVEKEVLESEWRVGESRLLGCIEALGDGENINVKAGERERRGNFSDDEEMERRLRAFGSGSVRGSWTSQTSSSSSESPIEGFETDPTSSTGSGSIKSNGSGIGANVSIANVKGVGRCLVRQEGQDELNPKEIKIKLEDETEWRKDVKTLAGKELSLEDKAIDAIAKAVAGGRDRNTTQSQQQQLASSSSIPSSSPHDLSTQSQNSNKTKHQWDDTPSATFWQRHWPSAKSKGLGTKDPDHFWVNKLQQNQDDDRLFQIRRWLENEEETEDEAEADGEFEFDDDRRRTEMEEAVGGGGGASCSSSWGQDEFHESPHEVRIGGRGLIEILRLQQLKLEADISASQEEELDVHHRHQVKEEEEVVEVEEIDERPRKSPRKNKGSRFATASPKKAPPAKGKKGKGKETRVTPASLKASPSKSKAKGKGKAINPPPPKPKVSKIVKRVERPCKCGVADGDGEAMVFCEGPCETWYHLDCVGISDERELPDDWFCENCLAELEKVNSSKAAVSARVPTVLKASPKALRVASVTTARKSLASRRKRGCGARSGLGRQGPGLNSTPGNHPIFVNNIFTPGPPGYLRQPQARDFVLAPSPVSANRTYYGPYYDSYHTPRGELPRTPGSRKPSSHSGSASYSSFWRTPSHGSLPRRESGRNPYMDFSESPTLGYLPGTSRQQVEDDEQQAKALWNLNQTPSRGLTGVPWTPQSKWRSPQADFGMFENFGSGGGSRGVRTPYGYPHFGTMSGGVGGRGPGSVGTQRRASQAIHELLFGPGASGRTSPLRQKAMGNSAAAKAASKVGKTTSGLGIGFEDGATLDGKN